jgi:hypothetical protein
MDLNNQNTVEILVKYIEIAQQKGAYLLSEADVLNRARDVLLNGVQDDGISVPNARQLLMQGVVKGQRHGAYSLADAALLHNVVQYVSSHLDEPLDAIQESPEDHGDSEDDSE